MRLEALQQQLQAAEDGLDVSRRREAALQQQVDLRLQEEVQGWSQLSDRLLFQLSRLLGELQEARDAQSPEVRLLGSLERKLLSMELRHQSREQELQQVPAAESPAVPRPPPPSGPVPLCLGR